jgi:hypothetical protein
MDDEQNINNPWGTGTEGQESEYVADVDSGDDSQVYADDQGLEVRDPEPFRPLQASNFLKRQVLPNSPIEQQFQQLEENAYGDPFVSVRKASELFRDYWNREQIFDADPSSLNEAPGAERLYNTLGRKLLANAETYLDKMEAAAFIQDPGETSQYANREATRRFREGLQERMEAFVPSRPVQFYRDEATGNRELTTGFVARAGVEEYRRIFSTGSHQRAVFFQFQQSSIVSMMLNARAYGTSWDVVTQNLDFQTLGSPVARDDVANQVSKYIDIFAGNRLTMEANKLLEDQHRQQVTGVTSAGSFHIKAGYTLTPTSEEGLPPEALAFFGSQNITPALARRGSSEMLMTFKVGKRSASELVSSDTVALAADQVESEIGQEVMRLTDTVLTLAKETQGQLMKPGELTKRARSQRNKYIFTEQDILPKLTQLFTTASKSQSDRVVVMAGELKALLGSGDSAATRELRQSALSLAQVGRLTVIGDEKRVFQQGLQSLAEGTAKGIGGDILKALVQHKQLRSAPTAFVHDKATMVLDESGELKAFAVGSANYSAEALVSIKDRLSGELPAYAQNSMGALAKAFGKGGDPRSLSRDILDSTLNTEALMVLGSGEYGQEGVPDTGVDRVGAYLERLNREGRVVQHVSRMAGREGGMGSESRETFSRGFLAEQYVDVQGVEALKAELEGLTKQLPRGSVTVEGRYGIVDLPNLPTGSNQGAALTGLRVNVRPVGGLAMHQTSLNLTVTRGGAVVLTDQNKVISGSIYVNKTDREKALTGSGDQIVMPGHSMELSAIQTAAGLVETISYAMEVQSRKGLVDEVFKDYIRIGDTRAGEQFLADTIYSVLDSPVLARPEGDTRPTLNTMVRFLNQPGLEAEAEKVLNVVKHRVDQGAVSTIPRYFEGMTQAQVERRTAVLNETYSRLLDPVTLEQGVNVQRAVQYLNHELHNDVDGILTDIKVAMLSMDARGAESIRQGAKAQSKAIVDLMTAPFLMPHGMGYSASQASSRLPVYGEVIGDVSAGRERGILNPLNVKSATKITDTSGKYIRLIGAVSYGARGTLPGGSGLRQLRTVESSLGVGAVSVYDTLKVAKSTAGMGFYTADQMRVEINNMLNVLGMGEITPEDEGEVAEMWRRLEEGIVSLPFSKIEQIPQRLKNTMGSRSALDMNMELVSQLLNLQGIESEKLNPNMVTTSRLRGALPAHHFERVKKAREELRERLGREPNYEEVQAVFRDLELDPYAIDRGVLGPTKMQRVAVSMGLSLMGDFSYNNAGFTQKRMESGVTTIKFSSSNVYDPFTAQSQLTDLFQKGAFVLGRATKVTDASTLAELGISADPVTGETNGPGAIELKQRLQERRDADKFFNNFFVYEEPGDKAFLMIREGLYTPGEGGRYYRSAGFNEEGRLLTIGVSKETEMGRFYEQKDIGVSAFTRRWQDGITIVGSTPSVTVDNKGMYQIQLQTYTGFDPTTGGRGAGQAELVKGPQLYLTENFFENVIQGHLDAADERINYKELMPSNVRNETIYGLYSMNTFKGFSFASGIGLLADADSRAGLKNIQGEEIARSLALMFMSKDKSDEVRQALIGNIQGREDVPTDQKSRMVEALTIARNTKDYSKSGLGLVAAGLGLVSGGEGAAKDIKSFELTNLKETVVSALQGDAEAQRQLHEGTTNLIDLATTGENAIIYEAGKMSLNESSSVVRGGSLLANVLFMGRQLLDPGSVYLARAHDLGDFSNRTEDYFENVGFRQRIQTIATLARLELPADLPDGKPEDTLESRNQVRRTLRTLQMGMDAQRIIEVVQDQQISRSLTPAGSADEIDQEYQYLVGATRSYSDRFQQMFGIGEETASIQRVYSILVSSNRLGLPDSSALLPYRILIPGQTSLELNPIQRLVEQAAFTHIDLGYTKQLSTPEELYSVHQIATGALDMDAAAVDSRSLTLAINPQSSRGFQFLSREIDSEVGRAQNAYLDQYFERRGTEVESPFMRVVSEYAEAVSGYMSEARKGDIQSFSSYISTLADPELSRFENRFGFGKEMEDGEGRIRNLHLHAGRTDTIEIVSQHVERVVLRAQERLASEMALSAEKRFLKGMIALEEGLLKGEMPVGFEVPPALEGDARTESQRRSDYIQEVRREVQKTKQIILPRIETRYDPNTGMYAAALLPLDRAKPAVGLALGTDVLKKAPISFPGYESELLRNQFKLHQMMYLGSDLIDKIQNQGALTEQEVQFYLDLEREVEKSGSESRRLLETNMVRKAYGDRQTFQGFVGIAVNSFLLDADQIAVGERARSSTRKLDALKVIDDQINKLWEAEAGTQFETQAGDLWKILGVEAAGRSLGEVAAEQYDRRNLDRQRFVGATTSEDLIARMENMAEVDRAERSKGSLREFKDAVYSFYTGLPVAQIFSLRNEGGDALRRQIALSEGAARRTGSPTLSSGETNAQNVSQVLGLKTLNEFYEQTGSSFQIDVVRSQTALILPTVGRLLPMLGDFDGDSYSFVTGSRGFELNKIRGVDREIQRRKRRVRRLESELDHIDSMSGSSLDVILDWGKGGLLTERHDLIVQIEDELRELEEERAEMINNLPTIQSNYADRKTNPALDDVKEWVGQYLALPNFTRTGDSALNTGELMTMVQMMRALFPAFDDNQETISAAYSELSDERFSLYQMIEAQGGFDSGLTPEEIAQQLAVADSSIQSADVQRVLELRESLSLRGMEDADVAASLRGYYLGVASDSASINTFSKMLGKAAGSTLALNELESVQNVLGHAGTTLIGEVYNAFAPLTDTAMKSNAMSMMLANEQFRMVLDDRLTSLGPQGQELSKALGLTDETQRNIAQQAYQQEFYEITGLLSAMQQSVRDALKFKDESGLAGLLKRHNIADALANITGEDPVAVDRERMSVLKKFVDTYMGPDIKAETDQNIFGQYLSETLIRTSTGEAQFGSLEIRDPGLLGFGAMLKVYEFAQAEEGRISEVFNERMQQAYVQAQEVIPEITEKEFAASYLVNMLQRTQAAFLADTVGTDTAGMANFLKSSAAFVAEGRAEYEAGTLDDDASLQYELGQAYLAAVEQGQDSSTLRKQYLEASMLQTIRSREGINSETILSLREKTQLTLAARSGESEFRVAAAEALEPAYGALNLMLRRGQQASVGDVIGIMNYELEHLERVSTEYGMSIDEVANFMTLSSLGLPDGGVLPKEYHTVLAQALASKSPTEMWSPDDTSTWSPAQIMQAQMAQMQAMLAINEEKVHLAQQIMGDGVNPNETARARYDQLNEILEGYRVQGLEQQMQDIIIHRSNMDPQNAMRITAEAQQRYDAAQAAELRSRSGNIVAADPSGEMFGALVTPLLFALMADAPEIDDRVYGFGLDIVQSVANINTHIALPDGRRVGETRSMVSRLTDQGSVDRFRQASADFQMARIRQMVSNEGYALGSIQAAAQEVVFAGTSRLATQIVDNVAGVTGLSQMSSVRAGGTAVAEVISTVLALSISRNLAGAELSHGMGAYPDATERAMSEVATYVWQMAEQALLSLYDRAVEVMDTDENQAMDFNPEAAPSELEADLQTGMVVVDETGEDITEDFSGGGQDWAGIYGGASVIDQGSAFAG